MRIYKVRITEQARDHLRAIRLYIAEELLEPETAQNMIAVLREAIQGLERMPQRIKRTEEEPWRNAGVRRMRVKNYYVYFWIDEEAGRVQVIAVIYSARDQAAQLKRLEKI